MDNITISVCKGQAKLALPEGDDTAALVAIGFCNGLGVAPTNQMEQPANFLAYRQSYTLNVEIMIPTNLKVQGDFQAPSCAHHTPPLP